MVQRLCQASYPLRPGLSAKPFTAASMVVLQTPESIPFAVGVWFRQGRMRLFRFQRNSTRKKTQATRMGGLSLSS